MIDLSMCCINCNDAGADCSTHQLRMHMMHIGNPILGDSLYGDKSILQCTGARFQRLDDNLNPPEHSCSEGTAVVGRIRSDNDDDDALLVSGVYSRLCLHACELHILHPSTAQPLSIICNNTASR